MDKPIDREWIEWGRERALSGSDSDLELIRESWPNVANEYRLHWMPFALGISQERFLNYLINLEITTEDEYRSAESRLSNNPSWFEVLCEARIAFYGQNCEPYCHLQTLYRVIGSRYPQLEMDPKNNSLRYGDVSFIPKYPDTVPFENMFEDFLAHVQDERRVCWVQMESGNGGDEPILFAKPESADRLCRRLELGCTILFPRAGE